jgi:hypothetical protein
MNKFYFKALVSLLILNFLFGCQSLKDGLEGNKKSKSAEEFLIEKKNPLVLPPDFTKLPLPKNNKNENIYETNENFDLEKILKKSPKKNDELVKSKNKTSLSKSVLKKIKEN